MHLVALARSGAREVPPNRWVSVGGLDGGIVVAKLEILAGGRRQHRLSRPGTARARLRGLLDDGAPCQLLVADPRCDGLFWSRMGAYLALALYAAAYQADIAGAAVSGGSDRLYGQQRLPGACWRGVALVYPEAPRRCAGQRVAGHSGAGAAVRRPGDAAVRLRDAAVCATALGLRRAGLGV